MRLHRQTFQGQRRQTSYDRLSKRLDEVADREGHYSNAEIIRRMREHFFADVEALAKSGAVKIPE